MDNWPHAPLHWFKQAGLYCITASTYQERASLSSDRRPGFSSGTVLRSVSGSPRAVAIVVILSQPSPRDRRVAAGRRTPSRAHSRVPFDQRSRTKSAVRGARPARLVPVLGYPFDVSAIVSRAAELREPESRSPRRGRASDKLSLVLCFVVRSKRQTILRRQRASIRKLTAADG
jgi:hypothetical protein